MAEEKAVGCARPTGGLVGEERPASPEAGEDVVSEKATPKEAVSMIKVGKKAPDFAAPAYHKGAFTSVKLSDHLGKWLLLCFYPGDFTFV